MSNQNVEDTVAMEEVPIAETFGIQVDSVDDGDGNLIEPTIQRPIRKGPHTPAVRAHHFAKDFVKWTLLADGLTNERRIRPLMFVGDKGCGKTQGILQMAARLHRDVIRIQCGPTKDLDYFLGRPDVKNGETVWVDGPVTFAWRHGYWILFDEFDGNREDVNLELNSILEGDDILLESKGIGAGSGLDAIKVKRHPNARIFGTSNTGGVFDATGRMRGARQQNAATMDRWWIVRTDYPPQEVEKQIVIDAVPGLDESAIDLMLQFANLIREGFKGQQLTDTMSTRAVLDWAELSRSFGDAPTPLMGVLLEKLDQVSKDRARAIFDGVYGVPLGA